MLSYLVYPASFKWWLAKGMIALSMHGSSWVCPMAWNNFSKNKIDIFSEQLTMEACTPSILKYKIEKYIFKFKIDAIHLSFENNKYCNY